MWLFKKKIKQRFNNIEMSITPFTLRGISEAFINVLRLMINTQIMELSWMINKVNKMNLMLRYMAEKDELMRKYDGYFLMGNDKDSDLTMQ